MNDVDLIDKAKSAMKNGEYDQAIKYTREMKNNDFSIRFELLIIEHEKSNSVKT
jgi:pentatricopeptide repeat protein